MWCARVPCPTILWPVPARSAILVNAGAPIHSGAMHRRSTRAAAALLALTALAALSGCEKPLLSPDEDRSPFDRYDTVRNQHADQYVTDEFGHRRPNLRERLMPKE
jgi:hypothetical protein